MRTKGVLFALLIAAGTVLPGMSQARTDVSVGIVIGPPPPPVVYVPPPRPGYVFAPGHWAWDGRRHVWVEGHFIAARPGYVWVPDRWERRGPRWHHAHGHWKHKHKHRGERRHDRDDDDDRGRGRRRGRDD